MEPGRPITSASYWDAGWQELPHPRFWSPFDPAANDTCALLSKHVAKGSRFFEIGFAPGKTLAWAALKRKVKIYGVDYSANGVRLAYQFLKSLGLRFDIRREDIFATTFESNSFDCLFSNGVIEHFDDPRPIVAKHIDLAKPGGKVIILIPNYGGVYGRLQNKVAPDNIAIHNTKVMSPAALRDLFPSDALSSLETFYYGRPSPSLIWLHRTMPVNLASLIHKTMGFACLFVPRPLSPLKPFVCAVATKRNVGRGCPARC